MPTYTFKCLRCKRVTEVVRSVARRDDPPPQYDCTDCSHEWKREIHPTPTHRSDAWGTKGNMK